MGLKAQTKIRGLVASSAPTLTNGADADAYLTTAGSLRMAVAEDLTGDTFLAAVIQGVTAVTGGAGGDVSIHSAAGSGVRNYITDVEVVNTSGDATQLDLYSGDPDSGGVLIASIPVGPNGVIKSFATPRKGAANTAIFAQVTGGDATVSTGGFTSSAG